MNRIVVVCTGNTCRSPMAEGIIRQIVREHAIQDVAVQSMGLSAYEGDAPSDYAVEALAEIGIDISAHRSHPALAEELLAADCIYVMTEQHKNVIVEALPETAKKIIVMNISDPFGQELSRYRQCRDEMLRFFTRELTGE